MAASTYFDQVQQLYIAYFGRPADTAGQLYWATQIDAAKGSIASVIAGFSASAESTALFGSATTTQKVTAIYQNAFGRAPEATGLAYWVAQIDSGKVSQAQASWTIQQSAGTGDAAAVANKLAAAKAFTAQIDTPAEVTGYTGTNAAALARAFLTTVDATPGSLIAASAAATKAVADATAAGTPVTPVTPVTPTVPYNTTSFQVSKDLANSITFVNQGSSVIATDVGGGVYTFTSNGASAGTFTVSGTIASILVPAGTTLILSSALATGKTFPGVGTVQLTDTTSVQASVLNSIDTATAGKVNADSVTTIVGNTADVKIALEAFKVGTALSDAGLTTVTLNDAILASTLNNVTFTNDTTVKLANVAGNTLTPLATVIATGKTLTVDGSALTGSNALTFDGTATTGSLVVKGGAAADTITAGAGVGTFTGGGAVDTFIFGASNHSTATHLNTITDFRAATGANAGAADIITLNDVTAVAGTVTTVQDLTAQVSLAAALTAAANSNVVNNGLSVFTWGGDTYAYVEVAGATTTYVSTDTVIKLSGTPFVAGATAVAGLGIDAV